MTAPMKKITGCVIYLIEVKYISYNYTSHSVVVVTTESQDIGF